MEKIDRRIKKSRAAIETAFFSLLLTEGFDQMTVKGLTEQADISRKTFYLHFTDKYQLLDTVVAREIEKLTATCSQAPDNNLIDSAMVWFTYFEENKALFSALFKSESTNSIKKALLTYLMLEIRSEIPKQESPQGREIAVRFLSTAVLGIVESFLMAELEVTTQEIAEQVGKLLTENLRLLGK